MSIGLLLLLLALCVFALLVPWLGPYWGLSPTGINPNTVLWTPSLSHAPHWLGTDDLGRDLMARLAVGAQISLLIGLATAIVSVVIGTLYGMTSAMQSPKVDALMMRLLDLIYSLPGLMIVILMSVFLGRSVTSLVLALSLFSWPDTARMVRGQVKQLAQEDFMEAYHSLGGGIVRWAGCHLLPNLSGLLILSATITVPRAILTESTLSFIGLGVEPPLSSWGTLASDGWQLVRLAPHLLILPAAFILITMISLNVLGDELRKRLSVMGLVLLLWVGISGITLSDTQASIPNKHSPMSYSVIKSKVALGKPAISQVVATTSSPLPLTPIETDTNIADATLANLRVLLQKTETLPIDLPTAFALVNRQNLWIAQDKTSVMTAKSRRLQAIATLLPNVTLGYNQNRFQGATQALGQSIGIFSTTMQPQVEFNTTLFPGGRTLYQLLATHRRHQEALDILKETTQAQLSQVAQAYYDFIQSFALLQNSLQTLQEANNQLLLTKSKAKSNGKLLQELSRAETQASTQQRNAIDAESDFAKAEQALLNRLNLEPDVQLLPNLANGPQPVVLLHPDTPIKTLLAQAMANNPTLKFQQTEAKAIQADMGAVRSDWLPSITLRAYLNGTGTAIDTLALTRFAGLSVSANLLEGMGVALPARQWEIRTLHQRQQQLVSAVKRQVEERVVRAFLDSRAFLASIQTTQAQLQSAEENYHLIQANYHLGKEAFVSVVDAQNTLRDARNEAARAVFSFNRAQVRLQEAIGGATVERLLTIMN
jgi:oligopeptide transport system permease protein